MSPILTHRQRLHVLENGGVIILLPEVRLKLLKGALKGMSRTGIREKTYLTANDRTGVR